MVVNDEVLARWHDLAAEGLFDLDLQICVAKGAGSHVIEVVRSTVEALVAEMNELVDKTPPAPDQEPPWPGDWLPVELPDGSVAVRLFNAEALDTYLPIIVEHLERSGISGEVRLCRWPVAPTIADGSPVLECRVLVGGKRVQRNAVAWDWIIDEHALLRLIRRAVDWLTAAMPLSAPMLTSGALPSVPLERDVDLTTVFYGHVQQRAAPFDVMVQTTDGFRIVSWTVVHSQLALIDVGATDWREPCDNFRSFLRGSADDVAYGYVRHGRDATAARHGYALNMEWPKRDGEELLIYHPSATAWWDAFIPDAFALQLLGPGYTGRVPSSSLYSQETHSESVLLDHSNPAAWYESTFVAPGYHAGLGQEAPPPPILATARSDLRSLLLRKDMIWPS